MYSYFVTAYKKQYTNNIISNCCRIYYCLNMYLADNPIGRDQATSDNYKNGSKNWREKPSGEGGTPC